jgi:hypothetical protein
MLNRTSFSASLIHRLKAMTLLPPLSGTLKQDRIIDRYLTDFLIFLDNEFIVVLAVLRLLPQHKDPRSVPGL